MTRHGAPLQRRIQLKCWWVRALAALSLCLLGAQGLLPALHQSLVSHRLCAEHGGLVAAHESHSGAEVHAADAALGPATPAIQSTPGSDHDEHCDCVLGVFLTRGGAGRSDGTALASPAVLAPSLAHAEAFAAAEILSFAPELSPAV